MSLGPEKTLSGTEIWKNNAFCSSARVNPAGCRNTVCKRILGEVPAGGEERCDAQVKATPAPYRQSIDKNAKLEFNIKVIYAHGLKIGIKKTSSFSVPAHTL